MDKLSKILLKDFASCTMDDHGGGKTLGECTIFMRFSIKHLFPPIIIIPQIFPKVKRRAQKDFLFLYKNTRIILQ